MSGTSSSIKTKFDGIVIGWSSSKIVSGSCAFPPRWQPQCSCVVIESSFDPGERLQAPGSLWFFKQFWSISYIIYSFRNKWGWVEPNGTNITSINFKSDLYVIFPFNFFAKSNRFCIVLVLIRGQNRSNTQNVELLF